MAAPNGDVLFVSLKYTWISKTLDENKMVKHDINNNFILIIC